MKTMIALQVGVMGLALGASRLAQATEGVGSNPTSGTFAVIPSFVARAAPDLMGWSHHFSWLGGATDDIGGTCCATISTAHGTTRTSTAAA